MFLIIKYVFYCKFIINFFLIIFILYLFLMYQIQFIVLYICSQLLKIFSKWNFSAIYWKHFRFQLFLYIIHTEIHKNFNFFFFEIVL